MSVPMYAIARDDAADTADAQNIEKARRRMRAKRLTEPLEHTAQAKADLTIDLSDESSGLRRAT